MPSVTFEFSVDVDDVHLSEDAEEEEIEEVAREILATAPAFDGLEDHFISDLDVASIEQ